MPGVGRQTKEREKDMKKIIDGKTYNTETAECLGEYSYGIPGDYHYYSEGLYRSQKGTYFIYGEGGALSKYARLIGNHQTGGDGLNVISEEEALKWAEHHLSADDYICIFGEPEEG